jgi:hypothetical protein
MIKTIKVRVGSIVRLKDEGVQTVAGFAMSVADLKALTGELKVTSVEPVPIDDAPGYLSIYIDGFDALLGNTDKEIELVKY